MGTVQNNPYTNPYMLVGDVITDAVRNGKAFYAYVNATLASAAVMEIGITVPDGVTVMLTIRSTSSLGATLSVLEDVGAITDGTVFTPLNLNRNSGELSECSVRVGSLAPHIERSLGDCRPCRLHLGCCDDTLGQRLFDITRDKEDRSENHTTCRYVSP